MKFLLVRLDKIGDLVSTLPVDQVEPLKKAQITWAISEGLGFLTVQSIPPRNCIELDKSKVWPSFLKLYQFLRSEKFDGLISFQAPWWVSFAAWIARVPLRVGVLSQWHSFLFLNKALRQKRSFARQHEADYNKDLVYFAFDQLFDRQLEPTPILHLRAPIDSSLLSKHQLEAQKYFVVHPGMAGSALNWPVKNYISLIEQLLTNHVVALTGTAADEAWLSEIKKKFTGHPNFRLLQGQLNSNELLNVLKNAKLLVAPSTGVLHLAASLGTPAVGIYSPIQVQKSIRWRARGEKVQILDVDVKCPATHHCLGEKCPDFFCLEKITVAQVLQTISK